MKDIVYETTKLNQCWEVPDITFFIKIPKVNFLKTVSVTMTNNIDKMKMKKDHPPYTLCIFSPHLLIFPTDSSIHLKIYKIITDSFSVFLMENFDVLNVFTAVGHVCYGSFEVKSSHSFMTK